MGELKCDLVALKTTETNREITTLNCKVPNRMKQLNILYINLFSIEDIIFNGKTIDFNAIKKCICQVILHHSYFLSIIKKSITKALLTS